MTLALVVCLLTAGVLLLMWGCYRVGRNEGVHEAMLDGAAELDRAVESAWRLGYRAGQVAKEAALNSDTYLAEKLGPDLLDAQRANAEDQ